MGVLIHSLTDRTSVVGVDLQSVRQTGHQWGVLIYSLTDRTSVGVLIQSDRQDISGGVDPV